MAAPYIDADLQVMLDDCHSLMGTTAITLTSIVPGAMNTTTGVRAGSTTTATVTAIRTERPMLDSAGRNIVEVRYGIRKTVSGSALSFVPKPGDTITDGSTAYPICNVERLVDDLAYVLTVHVVTPTA